MKTSNARRAVQVVLAAGVAVGAAQESLADDIFLNIPGIPGESVDSKHKDDIDVASYSQSVDEKQCQVAISKRVDRSSPPLAQAIGEKSAIPSATLVVRRSGFKDSVEYIKLTMSYVTVLRSEQAVGQGSSAEEVTLSARSITMNYISTNADGSPGKVVTGTIMCKK